MTTRRPKSMTGIFSDYARNRQEASTAKRNATKHFIVVSMKKKGQQRAIDAMTMRHSSTETREQAGVRKSELETMNPGKNFTIITL